MSKPQKLSAELVSMILHEVRTGVAELRVLEDTPSRLVLEFIETPQRTTAESLAEVERIARGES